MQAFFASLGSWLAWTYGSRPSCSLEPSKQKIPFRYFLLAWWGRIGQAL